MIYHEHTKDHTRIPTGTGESWKGVEFENSGKSHEVLEFDLIVIVAKFLRMFIFFNLQFQDGINGEGGYKEN